MHLRFTSATVNLYATLQFLDEADLLADTIAVLAAPGKLVAHGTPVALKSTLGEGYTTNVSFNPDSEKMSGGQRGELLQRIRALAPLAYTSSPAPHELSYHLKLKEPQAVQKVLELVENNREEYGVASYSVMGTSIEDIFLHLMHDGTRSSEDNVAEKDTPSGTPSLAHTPTPPSVPPLQLANGRRRSPFSQALTIYHKRLLIAKRSWLTPCLAVLVAVAGSCIPIFFLSGRAKQTCVTHFRTVPQTPLYLPVSPLGLVAELATGSKVLQSPPGIISSLGNTTRTLLTRNIPDNATFVDTIQQTYRNQSFGGVSVDLQSGAALFAWEATPPGFTGLAMLNMASNLLYNNALNQTGRAPPVPRLILANYQTFPGIAAGTLVALKWVAFFGAAMVRTLQRTLCYCVVPADADYVGRLYTPHSSLCTSRRSAARPSRRCSSRTGFRTPSGSGLGTCCSTRCLRSSPRRSSSSSSARLQTSSPDLASS